MRTKTAVLLIAAAALACRGRSGPAQRTQQQYDVIQEGQTSSATSTINAPGEVSPPASTATNTDTTGSFTLGTTPAAANMPGGPAGGVMPPQQPATPGAMASGMPMPARGSVTTRVPAQQVPIAVTTTTQPPPPPTDTATTEPPPQTQTTDTTSTEKPKKDKKDKDKETTDTSPPPPPTQTDTIGGH